MKKAFVAIFTNFSGSTAEVTLINFINRNNLQPSDYHLITSEREKIYNIKCIYHAEKELY